MGVCVCACVCEGERPRVRTWTAWSSLCRSLSLSLSLTLSLSFTLSLLLSLNQAKLFNARAAFSGRLSVRIRFASLVEYQIWTFPFCKRSGVTGLLKLRTKKKSYAINATSELILIRYKTHRVFHGNSGVVTCAGLRGSK